MPHGVRYGKIARSTVERLAIAGIAAGMTMAKRKAKRGRGWPTAADKSIKTLGYRLTSDYEEWITRAAAADRSTVSGLIDQAVPKSAREIGIDPPPNRTA